MSNLIVISSFLMLIFLGCDPCRDLAEKICDCKGDRETSEERSQCRANLALPKGQKFFSVVRDPKKCEEVFKHCSCEQLLKGNDEQCGSYIMHMPD
jgi:hypothetical protein